MTELQAIISIFFNVALAVAGWALKEHNDELKNSMKVLSERIRQQEIQVGAIKLDYLHKADFRDFKDELWARFDKLEKYLREG